MRRIILAMLLLVGLVLSMGQGQCWSDDDDDSPGETSPPGTPDSTPVPTGTPEQGSPTPGGTPSPEPTPLPDGMCRADADCAGQLCVAPGESAGCGTCFEPENPCESSDQCTEGSVCTLDDSPCLCSGPTYTCSPACTPDSCAEGEVCSEAGACEVIHCSTGEISCEPLTECTPDAGGDGCVRLSCDDDAQCGDGNACVEGRCYERYGTCSYPPPRPAPTTP